MKYITITEAAKKVNLSERSIRNYCQHGRIPGAILDGKTWLIPENFRRPNRTNGKENDNKDEFIATGYELIRFIDNSPVNLFAIDNAKKELLENGFLELFENEPLKIKKGSKFFVTRNGTSLIGIDVGENLEPNSASFHIIASHSDSPCFKIKPESDSKSGSYNRLNVEPYGGLIMPTWLDRPLSIAGRVIVKNGDSLESKLINFKDTVAMVPNVCIHFNREINRGYNYDPSVDLQAFISQGKDEKSLKDLISEELEINREDIINYDLYLYNNDKGYLWGQKKEFVSSPRLDDLECVYTSLQAFAHSHNKNSINVLYVADNEEVGSSSRQGADSDFLESVLRNLSEVLGQTPQTPQTSQTPQTPQTSPKIRNQAVCDTMRNAFAFKMRQYNKAEKHRSARCLTGDDLSLGDHGYVIYMPPHVRPTRRIARNGLVLYDPRHLKYRRSGTDGANEASQLPLLAKPFQKRFTIFQIFRAFSAAR